MSSLSKMSAREPTGRRQSPQGNSPLSASPASTPPSTRTPSPESPPSRYTTAWDCPSPKRGIVRRPRVARRSSNASLLDVSIDEEHNDKEGAGQLSASPPPTKHDKSEVLSRMDMEEFRKAIRSKSATLGRKATLASLPSGPRRLGAASESAPAISAFAAGHRRVFTPDPNCARGRVAGSFNTPLVAPKKGKSGADGHVEEKLARG